jgi:hypothetical protein
MYRAQQGKLPFAEVNGNGIYVRVVKHAASLSISWVAVERFNSLCRQSPCDESHVQEFTDTIKTRASLEQYIL